MQALSLIALVCSIYSGSWNGVHKSAKCQVDLIACYENKFPLPNPSEEQWVGGMKECVKERALKIIK